MTTQCKLFGSIFSSAVRKTIRNSRKEISKNNINELEKILKNIEEIFEGYRTLTNKYKKALGDEKAMLLMFTDEFMSNIVEYNFVVLYNYLKRKRYKLDSNIYKV